jgi:hypothetical protein
MSLSQGHQWSSFIARRIKTMYLKGNSLKANQPTPLSIIVIENLTVSICSRNSLHFVKSLTVHHRIHNSLSFAPIDSQIYPVQATQFYVFKIHFDISYPPFTLFFIWRSSPQWGRASSFTMFLDHTQRRTTTGRTPLDA